MTINPTIKKLVRHIAIASLMLQGTVHAAGFSLYGEGSAAATGNFAAGAAAEASDASTGWFNPAGLARIKQQQLILGGVGIFPHIALEGTTVFQTQLLPNYVQNFARFNPAKDAFVPSIHYAKPINDRAAVGISVTAPFGLSTEWPANHPMRYAATLSDLVTANISPEIGGYINDHFALGLGIDVQHARVKFNSVLGAPTVLQAAFPFFGLAPDTLDSLSYNRGTSWGVGFHTGGLLMFNDQHTRFGVNYQSRVRHQFAGHSTLTGRLAAGGLNPLNPFSIRAASPDATYVTHNLRSNIIDFPDVVTLSLYQDLNNQWALLGSAVYTGWHVLKNIQLQNVAGYAAGFGTVPLNVNSTEFYQDAWRFAVGANYKVNSDWMLRAGIGYDQSPVQDAFRTPRLPDQDRLALAIGTHWQAMASLGFDVGYTYLKVQKHPILTKTIPVGATSTFTTNASGSGYAHLVGAQLTWSVA